MRKIDRKYENPIDNVCIDLASAISPAFKAMKFTPNGITTLSLIFGLLSIAFLWKGYIWGFAITYFMSYFFDCLDGFYARKYKMVSTNGDLYDHVKDFIIIIGVFVAAYMRNRECSLKTLALPILAFVGITLLMMAQLGCQEKIYPKKESASLGFSTRLCSGNPTSSIKFLRFFGCGTWVILTIAIIVWLEKSRVCK